MKGVSRLRKTNIMIFLMAVFVFAFVFILSLGGLPTSESNQKKTTSYADEPPHSSFKEPQKGLYTFMGQDKKAIKEKFGEPDRVDPTQYGYHWWVYGTGSENYLQVGIDDKSNKVTTIYALGKNLKTAPFDIGSPSNDVFKKVPLSDTVSFDYKGTKMRFEITEDDLMLRPLIKFGNSWVQLNFDHITDKLMGVRYMSSDVLVRQRPYNVVYQGKLEKKPKLSDAQWDAVDQAESKEIFDMTNVLRNRYNQKTLKWNAQAADAAFKHSKEMKVKNYFSHDSKWQGTLSDRLEREDIIFQAAGENIAAQYTDSIASVLGWLNSEEHRKNMLSDLFSELGVGVYHEEYTQDFVKPLK